MTRKPLTCCLLTSVAAMVLAGCGGPGGHWTRVDNHASLMQQINTSGKPVLLDVNLPNCPACTALAPTLQDLADEYGDRVVFLKTNINDVPQLRESMQISAYPTVILFDEGEEQDRWVYERGKKTYRTAINSALRD